MAAIFEFDLRDAVVLNPGPAFFNVRCVHAKEIRVIGDAGKHHVIDAAPLIVQHQAVARAADAKTRDIAGEERL